MAERFEGTAIPPLRQQARTRPWGVFDGALIFSGSLSVSVRVRSDSRSISPPFHRAAAAAGCKAAQPLAQGLVQDAHQGLRGGQRCRIRAARAVGSRHAVGRGLRPPTNHWLLSASTTRNTIWRASRPSSWAVIELSSAAKLRRSGSAPGAGLRTDAGWGNHGAGC